MRVNLLSPVPPQKTGTADYISDFLLTAPKGLLKLRLRLVTDLHKGTPLSAYLHGVPIVDYASFSPEPNDLNIVFIANNHFHDFCFHFLKNGKFDKVITIVHDVQTFMEMSHLCRKKYFDFTENDMRTALFYEHPACGDLLFDSYKRKLLPDILKYVLCCNDLTISRSRMIIVHSQYAKLRLVLEYPHVKLPPIMIGNHPHLPKNANATHQIEKSQYFVVGCFGWISSAKRPKQVVRAFYEFRKFLSEQDQKRVELKFVGQLAEKHQDPQATSRKLGISQSVRVTGYVSKDRFLEEIRSTNLVVNLRFPSCGETSGTLSNSADFCKPTITSKYQAFAEVESRYRARISADAELEDIIHAMMQEFTIWKTQPADSNEAPKGSETSLHPPIQEVLLDAISQEFL